MSLSLTLVVNPVAILARIDTYAPIDEYVDLTTEQLEECTTTAWRKLDVSDLKGVSCTYEEDEDQTEGVLLRGLDDPGSLVQERFETALRDAIEAKWEEVKPIENYAEPTIIIDGHFDLYMGQGRTTPSEVASFERAWSSAARELGFVPLVSRCAYDGPDMQFQRCDGLDHDTIQMLWQAAHDALVAVPHENTHGTISHRTWRVRPGVRPALREEGLRLRLR